MASQPEQPSEQPSDRRSDRSSAPARAVVLLSGGLDSATTLAIARAEGFECYALTVRYGQRHEAELDAARRVADAIGVAGRKELAVDLATIGGSALTDDIPVPDAKDRAASKDDIPITYVPARNTIFLSLALAWAEVLEANAIFIGVNAVDYSGYPDCRPEFVEAFERLAALATKAGVGGSHIRVHAPLMELSKSEIIQRGTALGFDYGPTLSCYDPTPDGRACDRCEACLFRREGFEEAGLQDPATR